VGGPPAGVPHRVRAITISVASIALAATGPAFASAAAASTAAFTG
jgi:hypothetical protein